MRCLFRHAVGCPPESESDQWREALERLLGPDWKTRAAPPGWFHVGTKRDVPKDACAVGSYRDVYVWVTAEGRAALAQLTLHTLDVATILFVFPPPPGKEVTTFEYRGDLLVRQEKRTVIDPVPVPRKKTPDESELKSLRALKPEDLPPTSQSAERLNYFDPYRGLFFAPR